MTHILIPREPSPAMLRPFVGCPQEELPQAYAAMIRIAEVERARAGSQCLAQIEEPAGAAPAAVAGPAWDKTRDSLATLLLGLARRPFLDFDVACIALDAATEPGMPLAYMRGTPAAPALEAPAAPAVPAGFALVPIEPTQQMLDASRWSGAGSVSIQEEWARKEVWSRMLATVTPPPAAYADDLVALVTELVQALRKATPDNDLAGHALDYLKRNGLQESPLRAADTAPQAPAAPVHSKTYSDGTVATGSGELPAQSPQQQVLCTLLDTVEAMLGGANGPTIQIRAALLAAPAAPAVDASPLLAPETELDAVVRDAEQIIRDAEHYRFIKRHRLILSGGTDTFGWPIAPFGDECDRYIAQELATERAAQAKEGGAACA